MAAGFQPELSPGGSAFRRFLEWLDEGVDSGGEKYLEMRRRLASYFDRKNCLSPDELADETLTRVARRLIEAEGIRDATPAQYCYIVAKFVFLEYQRETRRKEVSLSVLPDFARAVPRVPPLEVSDPLAAEEGLLSCLERCLQALKADDRELILQYYRGERRVKINLRRELAARLGVTVNALSIRACRIRDRLEGCVRTCVAEE